MVRLATLDKAARKRVRRLVPLVFLDAFVFYFAYVATYAVRTTKVSPLFNDDSHSLFFILLSGLVMFGALYIFGGYNRLWSRTSGYDVRVIVFAVGATTALELAVDFFTNPRPVPLSVVLVGNMIVLMGFVSVRYRSRVISGVSWRWRAIWKQQFPKSSVPVLIVGAGDAGQTTAWRLQFRVPSEVTTYQVVGYVDDDTEKQGMYIEGRRVLGTIHDIACLVEKHHVELIIVAIHNIAGPDFRRVLEECERTQARIKIVPDVLAHIKENIGAPLLRDIRPEDLLGRQPVGWHAGVDVTPIANKVILVTGAAGSIGSELCRQLLTYHPAKLIMLDNNESGLHDLLIELSNEKTKPVLVPFLADITQRPMLQRMFQEYKPQVVFHSAAYKHVPMLELYPAESIRVNIGGTQQVAGLARDHNVERFVLISTDKAVNPSSVMGASKRVCEMLMHAFAQTSPSTRFTSVRFGNVLGSRGSVVPTFTRQIEAGGPVTVTDPNMTRYFMTIPEAVNLVIHAACLTQGDDLFMLRMGEVVRILDLAERMIRMRGLRPYNDIPIKFTGIRPGEKLNEELHHDGEDTTPTLHPSIVELKSRRNGLQAVSFSDRVHTLFQNGLDTQREALEQLKEVIALGESEYETTDHAGD